MSVKPLLEQAAALDTAGSIEAACEKLRPYIPESMNIEVFFGRTRWGLQEAASVEPKQTKKVWQHLLVILAYLRCVAPEGQTTEVTTEGLSETLKELSELVAVVIAPRTTRTIEGHIPAVFGEELKQHRRNVIEHSRSVSELGIKILEHVLKQLSPSKLNENVLSTLLGLTDETQEWTTPEISAIARTLLEPYIGGDTLSKEQFITAELLQRYVRSQFSRSKPDSITASGRKAEYPDKSATHGQLPEETVETKPWKYTDLRTIPIFAWANGEANTQLIAKHWPLFIPVLLTLVDDATTSIRRQGLLILTTFLAKFPAKTLHDTGLAQVFEDAIFPTLSFLPSLTPAEESVQLLGPAYGALLALARKEPAVGKDGVVSEAKKNDLLDKMIREGVFMGYFHAKEHVQIVEVLCRETVEILSEMGVHAVKHLKDLIPMLSSIMTDPFAPASPTTLLAGIKALQAVLANCWPRIPGSPWQDEIINDLVLCWLHLDEHNRPGDAEIYTTIEQELIISAKALAAVLKTGSGPENGEGAIDLASHVAPLLAKEPRLARLFPSN